jgi:NAD(P)H-quinone oxidoreductase subunit 5
VLTAETLQQIVTSAYLIPAVPFIVGLAIILLNQLLGAKNCKTLSMLLSVGAVVYGFVHSLLIFYALTKFPQPAYVANIPWFISGSFTLSVGVLVDNLASLMLIIVTSVSLLVQIYTHGYMREDPGYSRFYAYLSLFTGSMLGLVISTNLFESYIFWELVGVCSYFLIGFWWYKEAAAAAALKAFVVNRIGDCGFLIGILIFFGVTKDLWGNHPVLSYIGPQGYGLADVIHRAAFVGILTPALLFWIGFFMFWGPMAKSAQFPLHVWLPDAMEGPTPISALIHAATMVAAGVYLVARAYPIWLNVDGTSGAGMFMITVIGCITAFMAATIALSQFDIKRTLAWSTVSQLGYMFVGLGAGAFSGGIFHLFNHAFFKAMLFLCSGAVIHGLHGEQDMRSMGGLRKYMPYTALCFLIGTISISGFPPFSGFFSKDEIIGTALEYNKPIGIIMIITAAMTAFYMFRMYFMTFTGKYRGEAHPHESPWVMVLPLLVLAVPSVISGFVGFNPQSLQASEAAVPANGFASFIYFLHPHFEALNYTTIGISVAASLLGLVAAYLIYVSGVWKVNEAIANSKNPLIAFLYDFSFNKWRFDELYYSFVSGLIKLFEIVWTTIDKWIVDGIVNATGIIALGAGYILRYTQNGRGQYYALIIFAWVAGLCWFAFYCRP